MRFRFLISTIIVLILPQTYAQDNSKRLFVGGRLSYSKDDIFKSYGTSSSTQESRITVLPSIGYMLNEKISAGLDIGYSKHKRTTPDPVESFPRFDYRNNQFHINPFIRRALKINDNFYFHNKFSIACIIGKYRSFEYYHAEPLYKVSKSFSVSPTYSPELLYMLNNKFGIKLNLGSVHFDFHTSKQHEESDIDFDKSEHMNFVFDFDLKYVSLGLEIIL